MARFRKWLEREGWWAPLSEKELRDNARREVICSVEKYEVELDTFLNFKMYSWWVVQVLHAIQVAERVDKPSLNEVFTDVYEVVPPNLQEQAKSLRETVGRHRQDYPTNVPL